MNATIKGSLAWSAVGEIGAKFISPISTMILARLLTPDDFGVIAVCNMILYFADIIVDSGFGKYLIQREFESKRLMYDYASTAFWTNILLALLIWLIIFLFKTNIAVFLGKPSYANVITITSFQMVIVAVISTQMSIMRRDFRYKQLSYVRLTSSIVPLIITVPAAIILKSYWALIIGSFMGYLTQATMISILLKWKPLFSWSLEIFRKMFSFSFWSLGEGLAHWLIFWVDTFILTRLYDSYYVGLYKNSSGIIMSIFLMFATSIVPVLFSSLSRIHDKQKSFNVILNIERMTLYVLIPLCVLIWYNRDLLTTIFLGKQWIQASTIIGYWAIIMTVSISIYSFPAENFKAIGKPKYLFFYQIAYLVILIPACYIAAENNFWKFVNVRLMCVAWQIVLFVIFTKLLLHWNLIKFFQNLNRPIFSGICLMSINFFLPNDHNRIVLLILNIILCLVALCVNFKDIKKIMQSINLKMIN